MGTNRPDIIINPGNTTSNPSSAPAYYYTSTAIGDNITDAQPQLQADIDYCIANKITDLLLPFTDYKINKGLLIYKNNGTGGYAQVTLRLWGRGSMWDSYNTTVIHANFTDGFGIGIQQGKGCTVEGIAVFGKYNPGTVDDITFYNRNLEDCNDGICRNTRYSPNAGIVIDPFSNGQIPSDGGYPGWSSWYKGNNSQAGSTVTTINKCVIANFPVGIVSSPNGFTLNAEITTISNTKFAYCPLWIAGCQAQEKANRIIDVAGWADTHTCFATGRYGQEQPGHWHIDTVNIAGRCNRFIDNSEAGFYPTYVNNVFAEGIGYFGYIGGNVSSEVTKSIFHFTFPETQGYKELLTAYNTKFNACVFRYYGKTIPMPIMGSRCMFTHCTFSGVPIQVGEGNNPGWTSQFEDCMVGSKKLGITGTKEMYTGDGGSIHTYGRWVLEDPTQLPYGLHLRLKGESFDAYARIKTDTTAITVADSSFTFTSGAASFYSVGTAVIIATSSGTAHYYGVVSAVSGSDVTVSYCTVGIISGGIYAISAAHPVFLSVVMGDIISGTNQISNLRNVWGGLNIGDIFQSSYSGTSKWLRVIAISGSTYTVNGTFSTTKTAAYFGSNTQQEVHYDVVSSPVTNIGNVVVAKGNTIRMGGNADNAVNYLVTQTGWIVPPSGDARQALWSKVLGTWTGTQTQYDAIVNPSDDIIYYITNTAP